MGDVQVESEILHRFERSSLRGHHLDLTLCGKYLETIQIT